ncbi:MAG: hypothetical protein CL845_07820 [Crocinitomicaceae bacterium]|nr:hypothetical protein [Crocinitomicaceae bacterium]
MESKTMQEENGMPISCKGVEFLKLNSNSFFLFRIIKICLLAAISCFFATTSDAQRESNSNDEVNGAKQVVTKYLMAWKNDKCRDAVRLVPASGREGFCDHMDNGEWQKWLAKGFEVELIRLEEEAGIWPELNLITSARAKFKIAVEGELYDFYAVRIDERWYVQQ